MAFNAALSDMQRELPTISENGRIVVEKAERSKYALFEDINDAVRPILHKYGFAIAFRISQPEGRINVTALLTHREGHSEETTLSLALDTSGSKNNVQAV